LTCGTDTTRSPDAKDPLVGKTLVGKFTIVDVLGSGAMGTIYKAEQTALGKVVVIKVLHRHLLTDPELIQRFHREARAASRLNHPNCVQIMDFGTLEDGSLYIAMEYIQGIDLATLLEREHPIDHRRLIGIVKQVCLALDEAHANGVLHRDLKPENIMIEDRRTVRDFVKVVDFGIAKLEDNNPGSRRSFQTRTGIVCGTPEYMSPEQARGVKLDARSDLYAIGVMLYHLTTDHLPFDGTSPIEVVTKHLSEPPMPPRMYRADIPDALEQLIMTLLEKDREKRPASALDVHAELERIDRELAAERRERVEVKNADDATMVDMRPISQLVAAIDLAPASVSARPVETNQGKQAPAGGRPGLHDETTGETQREALTKAAVANTATDMSLSDTIPEDLGRQLGGRVVVKPGAESRPKKVSAAARTPPSAAASKARSLEPAAARAAGPSSQPKSLRKPTSAPSTPPISRGVDNARSPVVTPTSDAFAAELMPSPSGDADASARKKRVWPWVLAGGLVVAAGATLAVVLSQQ